MLRSARTIVSCAGLGLVLLAAACGSGQSKAESPEEGTQEPAGAAIDESEADPEPAAEPEPEGPELSRSVEDIITEPNNAWVFNFQSSEAYDKAQESCDARFKDKPKERAQCLSKSRSSFIADAMEFKKDASGQQVWVIYRAKGNRLMQIYSIPVSYGEEKAGVLQVKKAGKAKGSPPLLGSASEFKVKLLSNYVMELEDPKHGRMTYDARIGFINQ